MNANPCTIFALNISAAVSFAEGEYDLALFKLTSALQRTRKLTSRLKQHETLLQLQQQKQQLQRTARRQIKFSPATGNFLQVTADTNMFVVAQPFLIDLVDTSSTTGTTSGNTVMNKGCGMSDDAALQTCLLNEHDDGLLTCQDTTLLVAALLFNLGLCHHVRGLRQQQHQQQSQLHHQSSPLFSDLPKAIHFYQLALSSLQHYPAAAAAAATASSNDNIDDNETTDADLYLMACAVCNNLCVLYADYLLHNRLQSVLDIMTTLMAAWSQRRQHSLDAQSVLADKRHNTGSRHRHDYNHHLGSDGNHTFDFFRFNKQYWRFLRIQPAAAA